MCTLSWPAEPVCKSYSSNWVDSWRCWQLINSWSRALQVSTSRLPGDTESVESCSSSSSDVLYTTDIDVCKREKWIHVEFCSSYSKLSSHGKHSKRLCRHGQLVLLCCIHQALEPQRETSVNFYIFMHCFCNGEAENHRGKVLSTLAGVYQPFCRFIKV